MSGEFEDVLKINKALYCQPISSQESINDQGADWKMGDLIRLVNSMRDNMTMLEDKVDLYEKTFAVMFGGQEDRDRFIEMLRGYGNNTDNFDIIKVMNAFNKVRSIEKTNG